ncbi:MULTISPECIES: DUF2617 family protein [Mycolicibacterium]|uniref:DUF2617 family protein n=1 Tax=Mycolicibacterium TaxID=1866885 RepID=UPI0004BE31D4|nr:DUF2617 family protein [Mycolicibacterium neoaurum]QVI26610.1 DUF2617 family protein [Mycolicibacterium neoaurum]TLH61884.1 DUF2617 domain-containing protein [Mycolicibacterium neoaurum]
MPLHRLHVPPADVSGANLRLALNTPARHVLASATLVHPTGAELVLGVLGASHIVTVGTFSEQVSCHHLDDSTHLPATTEGPGYRMSSDTVVHEEESFRRIAAELRSRCEIETGWLGGCFPGDDAALTALCAEPDGAGWRWQTWHLYPDGGTGGMVVHTESRWRP